MAQVSLTINANIPDGMETEVIEKIAKYGGWTVQIEDPENPGQMIDNQTTALQYIKGMGKNYYKECYRAAKIQEAREAADAQTIEDIADDFT